MYIFLQTRKYVLYFSEDVTPHVLQNSIEFTPMSRGNYNGIVQLAYLGKTDVFLYQSPPSHPKSNDRDLIVSSFVSRSICPSACLSPNWHCVLLCIDTRYSTVFMFSMLTLFGCHQVDRLLTLTLTLWSRVTPHPPRPGDVDFPKHILLLIIFLHDMPKSPFKKQVCITRETSKTWMYY